MKITHAQSGFFMFDVIIAIGIISVVLLALLSYQITMLKSIEQSNFNLIATNQFLNFSEILLTDNTDSQKNTDFTQWNSDNKNLLPQGVGRWDLEGDHQCRITVQWFYLKSETMSDVVYC